jgi:hypothetical protein
MSWLEKKEIQHEANVIDQYFPASFRTGNSFRWSYPACPDAITSPPTNCCTTGAFMTHPLESPNETTIDLTRREAISRFALFGMVMAILQGRVVAQSVASGSYNNVAIALPQRTLLVGAENDPDKV